MNERTRQLREGMFRAEHGRHRVVVPAEWTTSHLEASLPERKAHALCNVLDHMPVFIEPGELIVGSRTAYASRLAPGEPIRSPSADLSILVFPTYLTPDERERFGDREGRSKGHYVAGYRKLLAQGLGGVRGSAEERLEQEGDAHAREFLKAVIIAYQGASRLALRYADLAGALAQEAAAADRSRWEELRRIEAVCRHISDAPPRDLHEALQLYWLAHVVLMVENGTLMSFGRLDQNLGPFFDVCPVPERQELLEWFLIKVNDQADMLMGEGHYGQDNVVLGGQHRDGTDATNALTYACLDALESLRLVNPQMNVRLHSGSPPELWRRTCEIVAQGTGQLSIYNDDTAVPALASGGFAIEDARDWALDACQDVLIEGCSDTYLAGSFSMTPLLMDTLNTIPGSATLDGLLDAYRARIRKAGGEAARNYWDTRTAWAASPLPFLSGTMDDCIGAGIDITEGGLRIRAKGMFVQSPVNAVNSLAALKRVVYDEKAATLTQVREACASDFVGHDELRQRLLAAPKWGNDNDDVDALGAEILEFACAVVREHTGEDGIPFLSGIHQPHHVRAGNRMGATPDGRNAGEPFPVTLTPVSGSDMNGPTAVIGSVTKIDPMCCQWNHALMLTLHPSAVRGPSGATKLESLIRTYHQLGGIQLQMNVVDADTLRDAQRHPERHRGLVVRVWGFCSYFVNLHPDYQDDLIRRTAHGL